MPRRRVTYEPPVYTFRVRILGGFYAPENSREIWRDIEIAGNQTLTDLGHAIPLIFGFTDPHLWSFYLNGKAWDSSSEYTVMSGPEELEALDMFSGREPAKDANTTLIRDVPYPGKTGKQEFLYLFDYGDEWHFGVKLRTTNATVEQGADYPRIVASQGEAPPQYPDLDDWDEEDEDTPEEDTVDASETGR